MSRDASTDASTDAGSGVTGGTAPHAAGAGDAAPEYRRYRFGDRFGARNASLRVRTFDTRAQLGEASSAAVAAALQEAVGRRGAANVVFAAAPSQQEFLEGLAARRDVPWERITAFHLDEYVGLPGDAPQAFGQFLRDRLFGRVPLGAVHYVQGTTPDPLAECRRYAALLVAHPFDVACIGIGENGHLAFNDPHVADFEDPALIKPIALDERSREQQVHDGCFASLERVPTHALTLTMPAILAARVVHCMVPAPSKAWAVREALRGPVSTACPASALRLHAAATIYLDAESAALL